MAALLAAVAVLAVSGCPFTPRDTPEPCTPGTPGCNPVVPLDRPLTAEIAFENIRKALRKGTGGPNLDPNYIQSLSPGFVYVPDADALSVSANRSCPQPFFAGWDRDREFEFMRDILEIGTSAAPPDTVELTYLRKVEADNIPELDVTRYEVDYVLTLIRKADGTRPRDVRCYAASALWDFSGVTRQDFLVVRWEDLASLPGASCPGGEVPGTLGMLRATDGRCP